MKQKNPYDSPVEETEAGDRNVSPTFNFVARVVEYLIAILLIAGLFWVLVGGKML